MSKQDWLMWALWRLASASIIGLAWFATMCVGFLLSLDWLRIVATLVAPALWAWFAIAAEPLRSWTLTRPKVGRDREARRSHRWLRKKWRRLCLVAGLASVQKTPKGDVRCYPRVRSVTSGPRGPVWVVDMLATPEQPQTPAHWLKRGPVLANIVGWPVAITPLNPRQIRLELLQRIPTAKTTSVRFFDAVNLDAPLEIGIRDDGHPFRVEIAGKQTLLVGASGSGKGSVIASVLAALGPAIRAGSVTADAIDLKGGVEATSYAPLLRHKAWSYDAALDLLRGLVAELEDRLTTMRMGGQRKINPSEATPLRLLIIDEAASLTYLAPDTKTRNEADQLLKRVLSTGRAAGYVILAALQDPRKEALASRDLYTQTIALRFRTKDDAVLAIGQAAYEAGARCEEIPTSAPGTGYAIDAETGGVVQFRAFWASDADMQRMASLYAPQSAGGEST